MSGPLRGGIFLTHTVDKFQQARLFPIRLSFGVERIIWTHLHHLTRGISSFLRSVNLILFTLLLVYLILCKSITSSQSPPSLSPSITPSSFHSRLKTHLFHKSLVRFKLPSHILNMYRTKWAVASVCFSFFFLFFFVSGYVR